MTAIADIVVKKNDGATNITWTAVIGSGGEKSPAVWRSLSPAGTTGQKPAIQIASAWNGAKTVRRLDVNAVFPGVYTNASTGQTEVRDRISFSGTWQVPQNMVLVDIQEAASQIANVMAASLFTSSVIAGYAPT